MSLKSFLKLVEIRTKVASIFPFIAGTLFAAYRFEGFNYGNASLMLVALLCIDMATTTLNNYIDFKKARKKHGYGYEEHNAIVRDNIRESTVIFIFIILMLIAAAAGIVLGIRSEPAVLILGILTVGIGMLYSLGPLPLSRTMLGELFSGTTMGYLIPFIAIIIHSGSNAYFSLSLNESLFGIIISWKEAFIILLLFFPLSSGIANIMLANNICDREDDWENQRFTLPVLLGIKKSLVLFAGLYTAGFAAILFLIISGNIPWWFIFYFIAAVPVFRHTALFIKKQVKQETFILALKNFVIQATALCALLAIQLVLKILFR